MIWTILLVVAILALITAAARRRAGHKAVAPVARYSRPAGSSRALARVLREIMEAMARQVRPGISTREIDEFLTHRTVAEGLIPYFKGFRGYPATSTVSVNEEVINTLPSPRTLREGDIFKVQYGISDGVSFAFQAWTYPVGHVSAARTRLLTATHKALVHAVSVVRAGTRVAEVSTTIAQALKSASLQPSAHYAGYRIDNVPMELPRIPCDGPGPDGDVVLREGMILAVFVLAHAGSSALQVMPDGWSLVSRDGSDSALFSHMVLVQPDGGLVLTESPLLRTLLDG